MSTNDKFNETPNHFIVLDAVSRGINDVDKIVRATKLDKGEVELIVNDLLTQRLIVNTEKKGFLFGRKKVQIAITEIGIRLLNVKKQELEQKRKQMQQSYDNGDGTQLQSYVDANRMWIPMMLFSGIMDMMFFTSMMSFMGLAMNPFENAMVGGSDSYYHDTSSSGGDDTNSADDQAGTSGGNDDVSNSGDFDSGGGFDSF
ncbi:MAG TPA: MarR family transcriptional regulator [Nitrososphaeraceae archaeon]|nr:MarR family transcriptional regulator [Nitrososphaeraceae archaeon]